MAESKALKNVTTEQKKNSQRLNRYLHQLAQRLDLQLQNANNWEEFFDPESLLLRQKLKDTCEQLLLNGNTDVSRRVEDLLWRKGFYDLIQKLRQDKKLLQSNKQLFTLYNAHLDAAHAFYQHLLFQLRNKFCLPGHCLDWLGSIDSMKIKSKERPLDEIHPDAIEWAIKSCQRCLVFLGDISRYRMDLGYENALALAERYYHQAIWMNPENGMPHNQLGTLKQQANYHDADIAYHYLRCLVSVVSFDGAEENLKRTFERNKCNEDVNEVEGEGKTAIQQFLNEFLELQESFRYKRLESAAFSRICQSVIEKFNEVLSSSLWKQLSSDLLQNHYQLEEGDMKFNGFANRISGGLMVKIFVICIITVSDLFQKNSEIVSAAVAFVFTMLSKLLDFICNALSESPLSISCVVSENMKDVKTNYGEEDSLQNENGHLKMRQRKSRLIQRYRRRRRRRKSETSGDDDSGPYDDDDHDNDSYNGEDGDGDSDSDLSEGELMSSDDGCEESDASTDDGLPFEAVVNSTESNSLAKSCRELDRKRLRNLCEFGKVLYGQIHSTAIETRRNESRNSLWNSRSDLNSSVDSSLKSSLNCFTEICYLQTFKIMADWLRYAGEDMEFFEKDLSCIWQKIAIALNELPSSQLLLVILQSLKRRNSAVELAATANKVLPEDISLIGLPFFTSLHKSLDYDWDSKTNFASILQFVIRVQSLRSFGKFLSEKIEMFSYDEESERFAFGKESKESHDEKGKHVASMTTAKYDTIGAVDNEKGKSSNELMKALAKQKLMHEVSELQDKRNQKKDSGMPPYLILDSKALCRHLSLIRSLAKSREFIMIVPIQVVQALDELKRYNPSAREAIKFLEEEFRQSSKWLRSQKDAESYDYDFSANGKKKKNLAIEEWRFYQVVKCSLFFANEVGQPHMVSILTSKKETPGSLGIRSSKDALEACAKNGIEVEPLVYFYQRWVAKKNA